MSKRTCEQPGCDRPHAARGCCTKHWKALHSTPTRWAHECSACGKTVLKSYQALRGSRRPTCSDLCRAWLQHGPVSCLVPASHASRYIPPRPRPVAVLPPPTQVDCAWCGTVFDQGRGDQVYCSANCKRRHKLARRKGRESDGHVYTWSHVIRVWLLLDRCCAYCARPIADQPEPDHVIPLSRHGSNGNGNILPSCRPCNSDKRDLLLHEWAEDRASRGKPPVRTVFDRSLPPYRHLLPDVFTVAA